MQGMLGKGMDALNKEARTSELCYIQIIQMRASLDNIF